jgi:hypothetical protein
VTEIRKKLKKTAGFAGESLEALDEQPKKRLGTVGFPDAHAETRKTIEQLAGDRSLELTSDESVKLHSPMSLSSNRYPRYETCEGVSLYIR